MEEKCEGESEGVSGVIGPANPWCPLCVCVCAGQHVFSHNILNIPLYIMFLYCHFSVLCKNCKKTLNSISENIRKYKIAILKGQMSIR